MLKPSSFGGGPGGTTDTYLYELTDHLGNVRAVISKTGLGTPVVVSRTDYYPFGMPMPNRNVEGGYRYGYQGEFAEKEPELGGGINSFQLRLWDSRIGRWMTPDPYNQYPSPYLGMGNSPMNGVDPDGGCFKDGENCNPNAEVGTVVVGDAGLEWRMTNSGEYVLNNVDDALQYTVVVGGDVRDIPFTEIMGIDSSPTMMFELDGKTVGVEHDYIRKEQWRGLRDMTYAAYGSGVSASFPTIFANTRTQTVGGAALRNSIPAGNAANHLFRGANKLKDTPANRQLITQIANGTPIATDKFGKIWHAKTLKDGRVIYTYSHHGIVKGAGVNTGGGIEGVLSRIQF